jgi:hypothetical protein
MEREDRRPARHTVSVHAHCVQKMCPWMHAMVTRTALTERQAPARPRPLSEQKLDALAAQAERVAVGHR